MHVQQWDSQGMARASARARICLTLRLTAGVADFVEVRWRTASMGSMRHRPRHPPPP